MTNETNIEQYARYIEEEAFKTEEYLKLIYAKKVPEPIPPTEQELSFWNIAGLESSLFVMSGIGSAILSAIRTGGLFWILEVLLFSKFDIPSLSWLGGIFGFLSMASALMAFEGFLLAYGLTKGKESGKMEVSKTGLIISITTVVAAGIFSSFSIVTISESWQAVMNIILALITGAASALVAYFSSENFGFILNHINAKRTEIRKKHQDEYSSWREQGVKSYTSAKNGIMKNINSMQSQVSPTSNPNIPLSEAPQSQAKKSKIEQAYDYVSNYYNNKRTLPTNKNISDSLNIAIGSAFKGLGKFIVENRTELLAKQVVTEEQVRQAMKSLDIPMSSDDKILQFIQTHGTFPMSEDIREMNISPDEVADYVVRNQDVIRKTNLLSEDIIQMAINRNTQ